VENISSRRSDGDDKPLELGISSKHTYTLHMTPCL